MLPLLTALLAFDPLLAGASDAIPAIVPRPLILHTTPPLGQRLRGDYESGAHVSMVYTEAWPEVLAAIAGQVVASGAEVVFVREDQSSASAYRRFVAQLRRQHGARVESLVDSVDTPWIRDWGPIQLELGAKPMWLDSDYVDDEREHDDEAPTLLAQTYASPLAPLAWALDGGAVVSNGAGLCVMTLEYAEEEDYVYADDDLGDLLANLGCRATALVPTLIYDATKHADMVVQFVSPNRAMVTDIVGDEGLGEDGMRMDMVVLGLRQAAASLGLELEITRVPTPGAEDGISYSFVNGLRLGDRYLMPTYPELGDHANLAAWSAIQTALGDATPVIPLDASDLIDLGGAIHCMTLSLFHE